MPIQCRTIPEPTVEFLGTIGMSAQVVRKEYDVDLFNAPFRLPLWFDYSATLFWALTGALLAARRGYDIAGIGALAFVSATGGGLLRDGIFLHETPPLVLQSWVYIALVIAAATIARQFGSWIHHSRYFSRTIAVVDALGLGGFAVTGVQLSLNAGLSEPAAAFVGIINAVGGGLLRDIMLGQVPGIFMPGPPMALAALAGAVLYLLLVQGADLGGAVAGAITVAAVFFLRVAALRYGWKTAAARGYESNDAPGASSG